MYKSLSENGETRYEFKTYENGEKRYFKAGSKLYRERIRFYVFQSNSIIFPKINLIVGQIDNGFFIQGQHIALSELNESIIDPVHNNTK